jgi:hypothetical protein
VSPFASQSAAEKSIPSRTTVECAVRKIVVAISSAIDASAFPTICIVTGSTVVLATARGLRSGLRRVPGRPPSTTCGRIVTKLAQFRDRHPAIPPIGSIASGREVGNPSGRNRHGRSRHGGSGQERSELRHRPAR